MRTRPGPRLLVACAAALACGAWAQPAPQAQPPARPAGSEPQVQRIVVEDESMRIDELRVRGQTQRITVTPKRGARAYEIVPGTSARDPSQPGASPLAGQRVWSILSF